MPVDTLFAPFSALLGEQALQRAINESLAPAGIMISAEDAHALAQYRAAELEESERFEFDTPAIISIAQALAPSIRFEGEDVVETLAQLQRAFYRTRDELPVDVPDDEIIEAIATGFAETGTAQDVAAMTAEELMDRSKAYRQALDREQDQPYRLADEQGRTYTFDPREWDYDETAAGWDGEKWADDQDE